jgi:hypothetical protein
MSSHLAVGVYSTIGGLVGLGSLYVAVAVGLRRQERKFAAESPTQQQQQRLRVVQPSTSPAPLPSAGRKRRRGELELLPPITTSTSWCRSAG